MNTCSNVCIRVEGSETLSRTNIRSQTPKGPRVSKACCRAATACATAYARPVLIGPGVPWRRQCLGSLMSRECCPRRASQRLISPILLVRARALQGGGGGAASSGGSARVAGNRKGTVRPKPCSACPVLRAPLCAARCRGIVDVNNLSACVWSASRVCRRPRPTGSCSSPSSSSPASPWSWCVRLSSCAAAGKAHGFGRECTRNQHMVSDASARATRCVPAICCAHGRADTQFYLLMLRIFREPIAATPCEGICEITDQLLASSPSGATRRPAPCPPHPASPVISADARCVPYAP